MSLTQHSVEKHLFKVVYADKAGVVSIYDVPAV